IWRRLRGTLRHLCRSHMPRSTSGRPCRTGKRRWHSPECRRAPRRRCRRARRGAPCAAGRAPWAPAPRQAEWGRMSFQRRKPRRAWEAPGGSLKARSPCHKACAACGLLSGRLLPCPSSARGPLCQVDRVARLPHVPARSPSGGIGRRGRLKICCSQERAGSSPAWGTTKNLRFGGLSCVSSIRFAISLGGSHLTMVKRSWAIAIAILALLSVGTARAEESCFAGATSGSQFLHPDRLL